MPSARTYISSLKQILTTDLSGQGIDGQLVEQAWLVLFDILKHEDLNLLSTPQLERLLEQRVIPTASTAIDPETSPRKLLIRFVRTHSLHQRDVLLDGYVLALKARGCSKATIRNYLSDIRQFFSISDEKHVESLLTETVLQKFVAQQENAGLATSSIRRKLTTAAQFAKWLRSEEVIDSATADSMYRLSQVYAKPEAEAYIAKPIEILPVVAVSSIEKQPLTEPVMAHAGRPIVSIEKDKSEPIGVVIPPSSVKRPRSGIRLFLPKFGIQGAVTSLALLLSVLGLSLLVRMQFLQNVDRSMAFPTVLTRPTRSLSFQGRLTDSAQNPITNATNMNFKLYTTGPSTTGGTILWNSGNCSVNPDQDGIFSTGLGSDCGAEIDANVFSENTSVWLQITVGTSPNDEVLSPRQSIKSVAYALNSETLQGYPASASAVENTVLVMNNAGEVVLANASPKIKSTGTSGLNIEGASLTLQTTGNGNVNLSPAGLGNIVASRYIYAPGATLSATYAGGDALTLVGNASSSGELTFIGATDPKINILNGENFGIRTSVGGLAGLAERLTVLNNGFVGVGTPTPGYRFDVVSGTAIAARFDGRVIGVNAVNSNELVTKSQLDAVGSALPPATTNGQTLRANGTSWVANSVLFNDGTNVGIGTTAPIANLDIQGSGTTMGSLRVRGNYTNDTDTNSRSHAKLTLTPNWNSGDYPFTIEASAFGPLKFTQSYWNGSAVVQRDVMQIDGSGFVGIGTTVPGARLEVAGQVKITGGSPGAGKVLTSDSVGLATWE
ncbi:site-specific integrase, partial [Candidatus Woesebacteria bacterium]|nr:site-specific integrase [Candidatus Woesebacteria bacterium]